METVIFWFVFGLAFFARVAVMTLSLFMFI